MEFIDKDINAVGGNAITNDIIKKIFPNHNTNYGKDRKKLWDKLKKDNSNLYKRMQDFLSQEQNHLCCYCMKRLSANDTTIEHVIPKSINDVVSFYTYTQYISYIIDFELSDLYLTTPHHAVPPYPHIYAYKNLTASCKGVNFIADTKTNSQSCNNFRLNEFITPMMFFPNIKQECQYYEDGEVIWIKERNQNPAIVALGLNNDMLKMIRRMWFGIQKHPKRPTLSTLEKYTDDERDEMIIFLNGILSGNGLTISDRGILNTFKNETYWNIFLKYDYFLNVTPSVKLKHLRTMAKIDYTDELQFEQAVVDNLTHNCGWKGGVFLYPTEDDLVENWKNILFENNNHIDILNGQPLTDGEMAQIISKVNSCVSPLDVNEFVNGKTVTITRDNSADTLHFGKEVSLKIYDRREIANGQSRYQIARQPKFAHKSAILPNRRGDLLLLINGMPLIHIELKSSKVDVSQAANQIKKYAHEGIFSQGIMKLVQIFVAMTPNETLYFANPGNSDKFNSDFYFHWGDFNNEPVNEWKKVLQDFLSIPMAHQMIGFYMVADKSDGVLKVLRSYQYYAAMGISTNIRNKHWGEQNPYGGYVWHTTGSGKTMTSFKAAQLAADSGDADKVVFLLDRIELGTQTLENYRDFKPIGMDVQDTTSSDVLVAKLISNNTSDTLIVTSIQKMSEIDPAKKAHDIETINRKRMVVICDECHRNTFGEMMIKIRRMFPFAIFFGFTGTPILPENQRKGVTSADIFGSEIHRYSIADGIRDGNVLGFDTTKILTYKDKDLRQEVALKKAESKTVEEAMANEDKQKIFLEWMNQKTMVEIENEVPKSQYTCAKHKNAVVDDILDNWQVRSVGGKFHAILATCSIPDAIEYYRIFKSRQHDLKITVLFDPNIDNEGDTAIVKEDGLVEILTDYNDLYGKNYKIPTAAAFKKDLSARLAHKKPYYNPKKGDTLDLLIVVKQMLTGFDSKWINTLYLDKKLLYQEVIQAFSRTNRLFNKLEKPFGQIYFYYYPHTQELYNEAAIALYSGDREYGMLVQKLPLNIKAMNKHFEIIKEVFDTEGIHDFSVLPSDDTLKVKFAQEFRSLTNYLASAKIQGFVWSKLSYYFEYDDQTTETVVCEIDERTYNILLQRYKELVTGGGGGGHEIPPFPIDTHITEIDTDKIDADYMNTKFQKFLLVLNSGTASEEERKAVRLELHNSFASLSQEDQRFAEIFINDLLKGAVDIDSGKTFKDYVVEYRTKSQHDILHKVAEIFGLNEQLLRDMRSLHLTDANINEYSRFDNLMATVDWAKAASFVGKESLFIVKRETDKILRKYIIDGEIQLS